MSSGPLVCIILARAGSKRLPGKNRAPLAGRPLFAWTVEAAVRAGCFESIVFSTDDAAILEELRAWPEVLALPRPLELAGDEVVAWEVCRHLIATLPEVFAPAGSFCLLTPCHPFRTAAHLREAVRRYQAADAQSLLTVSPYPCPPELALELQDGYLTRTWDGPVRKERFTPKYHPNGALCILRSKAFAASGSVYTDKTLPHVLPWPWSLDIDDAEDLALARSLAPCLLGGGA